MKSMRFLDRHEKAAVYRRADQINDSIRARSNGQGSYREALQQAADERRNATPLYRKINR